MQTIVWVLVLWLLAIYIFAVMAKVSFEVWVRVKVSNVEWSSNPYVVQAQG